MKICVTTRIYFLFLIKSSSLPLSIVYSPRVSLESNGDQTLNVPRSSPGARGSEPQREAPRLPCGLTTAQVSLSQNLKPISENLSGFYLSFREK